MQFFGISFRTLISELYIICLTVHQAFLGVLSVLGAAENFNDKIDNVNCLKKTCLNFSYVFLLSLKCLILILINLPLIFCISLKYAAQAHYLRLLVIDTVNVNTIGVLESCLLIKNVDDLLDLFLCGALLNIDTQTLTFLITSVGNINNSRKGSLTD